MPLLRPASVAALALSLLALTVWPDLSAASEIVAVSPDFHPPDGGGLPNSPQDFAVHDGRLVMHGPFTQAGSISVNQGPVAWTGSAFSVTDLPEYTPAGPMILHQGQLVFGDSVWNGITLQPLVGAETFDILQVHASVSGPSGLALVADIEPDPNLHLQRSLIVWDGTRWQIQATFLNGSKALVEFEGAWFLANNFAIYPDSGDPASVLRYDGSWSAYPEVSTANDFAVIGGQLYLAAFHGLWVWNGTGWDLIPGSANSEFHDIIEWNGDLLACGRFAAELGGGEVCNVAVWDGAQWNALPRVGNQSPGLRADFVGNVLFFENELYAGGVFTKGSQPEPARNVARLSGSQWIGLESEIGFGIDEPVRTLGFHDGAPIASLSRFVEGPRRDATYRLQSNGWWEFSSGVRDGVNDYVSTAAGLVAVGFEEIVGGFPASDAIVERWTGSSWELLARGEKEAGGVSTVHSATVYDGRLVVAGDFDTLNLLPFRDVAAYDGSQWQTLDLGINGVVHDLIVFEGELVAIGDFFNVGSQDILHVARWDGTQWSEMGGGFSSYGLCLAIVDGTLYAGGALQWSGPNYTPYLARWDGTAWEGVPDPPDKIVTDMAGIAGGLYLTGNFTQAGGATVDGFAKLVHATQTWETPEFVPNARVSALHRRGSDLYLGGEFTEIQSSQGPVPAQYVGKIRFETGVDAPPAVAALGTGFRQVYPNPANPRVTLVFELASAGRVEIRLYDARGRQVRSLVDRYTDRGEHVVHWDGLDERGRIAASGVYFARLQAADGSEDLRKVTLAR